MTISLNPLRDAQTDVISQGQEAAVVADGGDVRSHLAGGIDRGDHVGAAHDLFDVVSRLPVGLASLV
jgi:hypothetical protein